jgi:hypothetical protein
MPRQTDHLFKVYIGNTKEDLKTAVYYHIFHIWDVYADYKIQAIDLNDNFDENRLLQHIDYLNEKIQYVIIRMEKINSEYYLILNKRNQD